MLLEKLLKARERIERGWCQGSYIRLPNGYMSWNYLSPVACAWCLSGACLAAGIEMKIVDTIFIPYVLGNAAHWNDVEGRTKEEVLGLLDQVIKRTRNAA